MLQYQLGPSCSILTGVGLIGSFLSGTVSLTGTTYLIRSLWEYRPNSHIKSPNLRMWFLTLTLGDKDFASRRTKMNKFGLKKLAESLDSKGIIYLWNWWFSWDCSSPIITLGKTITRFYAQCHRVWTSNWSFCIMWRALFNQFMKDIRLRY